MLKEFKDDEWSIYLVTMLCLGIFIVAEWVFINVPGEVKALWFATASIFVLLLAVVEFYLKRPIPYLRVAFFGKSRDAVVATVLALFAGVLVAGRTIHFGAQDVSFALNFSFIPQSIMEIIYAVILSPIIEELVFRGVLVFTAFYSIIFLAKQFRMNIGENNIVAALVAILLPNTLFGFYHYLVSGGDPAFITTAFSLGVIWTIGYLITRSLAFPVVAHIVNNAIVSQIAIGDILITFGIVGVVMAGVYYVVAPVFGKIRHR